MHWRILIAISIFFAPPFIFCFIAKYFGLVGNETNSIILFIGFFITWVTVLAGTVQILGFDLKSFFEKDIKKRSKNQKVPHKIHGKSNGWSIIQRHKLTEHFLSPKIVYEMLRLIVGEKKDIEELRHKLGINTFIMKNRLSILEDLELIEVEGNIVMTTKQGKFVFDRMKSKIHTKE